MVGPDSYGISRAPHYLGYSLRGSCISLTGLSPSAARFPNTIQLYRNLVTLMENCGSPLSVPTTPPAQLPQDWHTDGLGSTHFAHHYLGHLFRFLFLRLLRCFTSPGRLLLRRFQNYSWRVSPFRYPRVDGRLLLTVAFRSLLRLSSASGA